MFVREVAAEQAALRPEDLEQLRNHARDGFGLDELGIFEPRITESAEIEMVHVGVDHAGDCGRSAGAGRADAH
jgi:hypothetical protein